MSRLIALFLALALALTSQAFALARGQAAAAGEMVICSGGGFLTITVDAEGKPTGPAHLCPDALAAFGAVSILPVLPPVAWPVTDRVTLPVVAVVLPGAALGHAQARAPPIPV
jgi:hypothetical protein